MTSYVKVCEWKFPKSHFDIKDKWKSSFVVNLHTGKCIHGSYFIAGPSIHAVVDIRSITGVSMFYKDTTVQEEWLYTF